MPLPEFGRPITLFKVGSRPHILRANLLAYTTTQGPKGTCKHKRCGSNGQDKVTCKVCKFTTLDEEGLANPKTKKIFAKLCLSITTTSNKYGYTDYLYMFDLETREIFQFEGGSNNRGNGDISGVPRLAKLENHVNYDLLIEKLTEVL